ncbi:MAG TPA: class I SAM-dependent methyltransferase [Gammaproteobacteria bacterium]|nr:class I SAM-dependent methyltransferase [Gammaproteobacteria bacterium]
MKKHRIEHFSPFNEEYTRIRHAEGRGSSDASYYLRLPEPSPTDPMAWQWRMRAKSFQALYRTCLATAGAPKKIVDLGAGVGWLCHRLALLGHAPLAIDLSVDDLDGLGASRHYGGDWPRLQSEFDDLPFADGQADIVIYNASVHYSTDYHKTLKEGLRILKNKGMVIILDSPVYQLSQSGEQMKAERHARFEQQFGFRSDNINSVEYLTWEMLEELGIEVGLDWRRVLPWYGIRWLLRPWLARIRGRREPSRFALLIGSRRTD